MIYINAYGKKNQRLDCFRDICNDQSWRDEKDYDSDFEEQSEENEIEPIEPIRHSVSALPTKFEKTSSPIK